VNLFSELLTAFGLGFLYFISAIPTSVVLGAPIWWASAAAWFGYSVGGIVILLLGFPVQEWICRRWKFSLTPDPQKFFWRVLDRYGVIGLSLIAPITIGPQFTALILLALRIKPTKIAIAISIGVIPWTLLFAGLITSGSHFFKLP